MLKHHPDKRKAAGELIVEGDGDYFTCITKGKDIENVVSNAKVMVYSNLAGITCTS